MTELENSSDVEQLLSLSEELQTENEQMREQLHSSQQEIQKLSSDKLKLSEQVRKQMSQIQQQAELIEKLSNSDKELKRSEELEKQSKEREKKANEQLKIGQEEVRHSKQQYIQLANEAKNKIEAADRAADEATKLKKEQEKRINSAAEEKYNDFRLIYSGIVSIVAIYAIVMTVFTAMRSERFISDLQAFCGTLVQGVVKFMLISSHGSLRALQTCLAAYLKKVVAVIVHWLLYVIVVLVGAAIPLAILFFGGKWVVGVYKKYCWDELSVLIALFSVAMLVFFAEFMPLNCMLLLLISHVVYIALRWYIHGYREARS